MGKILVHPFRAGVQALVGEIVSESILKRFRFQFEVEMYDKWGDEGVWKQGKNDRFVMEIHYLEKDDEGDEYDVYICDVFSWETKRDTQLRILRAITDKFKTKQIGKDWVAAGRGINLSPEVSGGKYETPMPEEPVAKPEPDAPKIIKPNEN